MARKDKATKTTVPVEPIPGTPERSQTHVDISQRAVLVTLNLRQWGATATDERITDEVAAREGIGEQMGRYEKKLVTKEALAKLKSAYGKLRSTVNQYTLPWGEWSTRICSSAAYPKMRPEADKLIREIEQLFRDEFEAIDPATGESRYESIKVEAKRQLNGSYRESDYPTLDELKRKYRIKLSVSPVPSAQDFRVDLSREILDNVKADLEARANERVGDAMKGVFAELKTLVERLVAALREPEDAVKLPTAEEISGMFTRGEMTLARLEEIQAQLTKFGEAKAQTGIRKDLLDGISNFIEMLPYLNVTDDPALNEFAEQIGELVAARTSNTKDLAKDLRENASLRVDVRKEAEAILAHMNDFLG